MSIQDFANLQPFVRMVKIKRSVRLEGSWEDLDHVFIYNAKGSADWVISGKRWHLPEGSCLLIPPYLSHLIVKIGNEELVQYVLHVDLFEDAERKLLPHQSAFRFEQKPVLPEKEKLLHGKVFAASIPRKERYTLERLFLNMYREFSQKSEGYELMLKGQAMQMAVMLLRNLPNEAKGSGVSSEQQAKSWRIVENALEYIYLHYSENLENTVIGDAAGVSPNYLSKLFQEYLGVSLHTYVQNYRLEKAQQLLSSGKYNISEIALRCGFSSIHTFSKSFKKERGISPSAYLETAGKSALPADAADYNQQQQIYYNQ